MKNIRYKILGCLLISMCFFFMGNIKVIAQSSKGASLKEIYNGLTTLDIYEGDEMCFYKSTDEDSYVIIYFEYDATNNNHILYDVTSHFSRNYASYNNYFSVDSSSFSQVSGKIKGKKWYQPTELLEYYVYKGNSVSSICSSHKIEINSPNIILQPIGKSTGNNPTNNYTNMTGTYKDKGYSEKDILDLINSKTKISQNDKIACDIKLDTNSTQVYNTFLKFEDGFGWYLANGDEKICFAEATSYNSFQVKFETDINFKNKFVCSEYKAVQKLDNNHPDCDMYAIHKDYWNNVSDDITTSVHEAGSRLAVYVLYNNTSSPVISIYKKDDNSIDIEAQDNIKDKIIVSEEIKNAFLTGNKAKQPIYILETSNGDFTFDNNRNSNAKSIYIHYDKLLTIVGLGGDEIEKTCQNIFGSEFLTFLNNNVFRVIYTAVPILLLVLTTFDFAKVVFIDDKEGIQGAGKKFGKRVVAAVLIYLVPTIFIFVADIIGSRDVKSCAQTMKAYADQSSNVQ